MTRGDITAIPGGLTAISPAQVRRGLARARQAQCTALVHRLHARRIVVSKDRACAVSGAPIGDAVFVAYPNGTLARLGSTNAGDTTCPKTGRDFGAQPVDPSHEALHSD